MERAILGSIMNKKILVLLTLTTLINAIKIQQGTPTGSSTTPFVSSFGDMLAAEKVDSFNMMFQYNVPTDLISQTTSGTGAISSDIPFAVLTSSTNGTGSAQLESKAKLRYVPGHEGYAYFTAIFTTGIANSTQYIGLIDDNDGWAIGYNGTAFSIFWRRNTGDPSPTTTIIASTSFNLDKLDGTGPSKMTIDPTKLNVYRISFGWLGAAPIIFEILREDGVWFPFHMIKFPNTEADTSTKSSVLPLRAYAYTSSASGNVVLKTPSWNCGSIGRNKAVSRVFQYGLQKTGVNGNNQHMFTLRNSTTYPITGGGTNKIMINIKFASVSNKDNQSTNFKFVKNITFSTSPSYSDVDSTNSCIQYSTAGTYDSGGTVELYLPLGGKGQGKLTLPSGAPIMLMPGETLSVLADTDSSAKLNAYLRWQELL